MKKIFVPIKRVPDYEMKVKIAAEGNAIEQSGVKWILNPFDEIAVEEAVRLKEKGADVEITVISIGPQAISEQLRTALAMGADKAILVEAEQEIDSDLAARTLQKICDRESPSLVLMGKQAIDSDANQTGQLLAAKLGVAQATFISEIAIDEAFSTATVTREVDGGLEKSRIGLPAVVTTDLRLNEPRYPSLPGIVKAKKKPMENIVISDLGVEANTKIKVKSLSLPPERSAGVMVADTDELISKLKDEAGVL